MAKKKTKAKSTKKKTLKKPSFKLSNQQKLIFGSLLLMLGIYLFIVFLSHFFTGEADQSALTQGPSGDVEYKNWAKWFGAKLGDFFINKGFGLSSFIFAGLIFISGV